MRELSFACFSFIAFQFAPVSEGGCPMRELGFWNPERLSPRIYVYIYIYIFHLTWSFFLSGVPDSLVTAPLPQGPGGGLGLPGACTIALLNQNMASICLGHFAQGPRLRRKKSTALPHYVYMEKHMYTCYIYTYIHIHTYMYLSLSLSTLLETSF